MKTRLMAFAACLLLVASPGFGQATPPETPPSDAPAALMAPPPNGLGTAQDKDGKPTIKSVRETCRAEVLAGNAIGDARRQAMANCIIKQRPDMEAHIKCAMDPALKGLDKEARHAAVRACVQRTKN